MSAKHQCTVDGREALLPASAQAENISVDCCESKTRANAMVRDGRAIHAGSRDRARKCCGAFGIGLCYGVTLATMFSLALVYVELTHVKAELAEVQHQLRHRRHHHGGQHDERQQALDVEQSRPRDPLETDVSPSTRSVEDPVPSDDDKHTSVNRKVKRSTQQRRSSAGTGRASSSGVTPEQVRKMIDNSLSVLQHPSAHLTAYSPQLLSNGSAIFSEDHVLYWTEHNEHGMTHNNLFSYGSDYSRLVIQAPGTFYIYVQVMYNGRRTANQPTCSHTVKLFPHESPHSPRTLLLGSTTQYALGRPIYIAFDGSNVRAFDSVFLSGVFHLEAGDQLRVELDHFSKNCRIIPHADRTFFGAFRLHLSQTDVEK